MKRTRIARVSKKMRAKKAVYLPQRTAYLKKYFLCMVDLAECGFDPDIAPVVHDGHVLAGKWMDGTLVWLPAGHLNRSHDVHHTAGRLGTNLLDQSTWMAVSRKNHDRIHRCPKWARTMHFLK